MNSISLRQSKQEARIIPLTNGINKCLGDVLIIKEKKQWNFILHKEIIYCRADGNYCYVYTTTGREFLVSKSLKQVQAKLPSANFLRVHQSYVLAKKEVRILSADLRITMRDGSVIPLSRRKKSYVFSILGIRK